MSRFNATKKQPPKIVAPITSNQVSTGRTGNQAPGFEHDPRSELFLLGVANFVGQDMHYEKADKRDGRFAALVHTVATLDPDWTARFLPWLRNEANMRTASLIGGIEAARALAAASVPGGRQILDSVISRADEPGEALAYFLNTYGRKIPKPVKRGLGDAARRLYNEKSLLKYDTPSHAVRFGDVLELCHASPKALWQGPLFKYAIDRRHGRDDLTQIAESLPTVYNSIVLRSKALEGDAAVLTDSDKLKAAGVTWEQQLSLAGSRADKKALWEAQIPNMGYMALLRNLRNFDEAGVSDEVAAKVIAKLTNPDEVAKSRQLPLRFLSASRTAPSARWAYPLAKALDLSLQNVPALPGRTLILIDTSGSMNSKLSSDSTLALWDAAALFGIALGKRAEHATVVSYSTYDRVFQLTKGAEVAGDLKRFLTGGFLLNGGTATEATIRKYQAAHDRVIVLTDEQANFHGYGDVSASMPANKMLITFNLAGYQMGHAPAGTKYRVAVGGLTDSAFKLIPMLSDHAEGRWPF